MKISLEPTTKIVHLNGVPARVWEGRTDSGIAVHAFITRIALPENAPPAEHKRFERELSEQRPPSVDVAAYPLNLLL